MEITYRVTGLDEHGNYVPDEPSSDMIVEARRPSLAGAFGWAEYTLAADARVNAVAVQESIQDKPGMSWRAAASIALLKRAPRLTTAVVVARVVDTLAHAHFRDYAQELNAETQHDYRFVVNGLVCWAQEERRVLACTPSPDLEFPDLHAHVAADALDMAVAVLHGSPYAVPDTAVISHVAGRTWDICW